MAMKKTTLMTEGNIWKQILFFSIPLILGNLLQQLYNTADSIIVGNFVGSEALAAVGSSGSLINLLNIVLHGSVCGCRSSHCPVLWCERQKESAGCSAFNIGDCSGDRSNPVYCRNSGKSAALAVDGNSEGGYAEFGSVSADFLRRTCVQCDLQYGSWNFKWQSAIPNVPWFIWQSHLFPISYWILCLSWDCIWVWQVLPLQQISVRCCQAFSSYVF